MATVQSVIDSARYDLHDYQTGLQFDDVELLNYMNRMVGVMDSVLAAMNSDLVEAEELDIDCVSSQNYVDLTSALNSGLWDSIRNVYLNTKRLYPISIDLMRYKRLFRSGTGTPYYYALSNRLLLFDIACSSAFTTLAIYYNKKTAELALTDSMPYNDTFNEFLRANLVMYAQAKANEGSKGTGIDVAIFTKRAHEEVIRRSFNRKHYYIDF